MTTARALTFTLAMLGFLAGPTGVTPAGRAEASASTDTLTSAAKQFETRVDAILTAASDAKARAAARRVLPSSATKALAERRALASTGLAVKVAHQSITVLRVQQKQNGTRTLRTVVDHSYQLVKASTGARETTWQEATPTVFRFASTTTTLTAVVEIESTRATASPGSPPLGPKTSTRRYASAVSQAPLTRPAPNDDGCSGNPDVHCYSATYAVYYAVKHACRSCHDPDWHYYDGEDCTNFMSTTVYNAGWPMHDFPYTANSAWWYKGSGNTHHTLSWTIADNLYWYFNYSSWARHATRISSLVPGDIVQADWGSPNGVIDHTMMVTKKDTTGLYFSYHSNDTVNKPFSVIIQDEPGSSYYGWLMAARVNNS